MILLTLFAALALILATAGNLRCDFIPGLAANPR